MKIAFLVLAHTDPVMLHRLIDKISENEDDGVFVHLDKKVNIEEFKIHDNKKNLTVINNRESINWAGFSMIEATMNLIRAALRHEVQYDYFVLLSGQDYPIKKINNLRELLVRNNDTEFINFFDVEDGGKKYQKHINHYWFKDPWFKFKHLSMIDKIIRRLATVFLKNYTRKNNPFKKNCFGSQWWGLSRKCTKFILNQHEINSSFKKYHRYTFSPDEHYIQSIVANSPFLLKAGGVKKYNQPWTSTIPNFHVLDESLSKYYTIDDFETLKESNLFFVRKVNTKFSLSLLEKIDNELI